MHLKQFHYMEFGGENQDLSNMKNLITFILASAGRICSFKYDDITVIDTLLLVQFYDISAREMSSYTLKDSAIHFGISVPR